MDVRFRPYATWGHGATRKRKGRFSFRAGWADTLDLLDRELHHLRARDVVIGAALRETDIRLDGWPRANAAAPWHPGVEISFEMQLRAGEPTRLVYATDEYEFWQHNVRAIALGLQALRAVDRYGITRDRQQYAGWKALGAGQDGHTAHATRARGVHLIDQHGGVRAALRATHPDRGGDPLDFQSVQMARES